MSRHNTSSGERAIAAAAAVAGAGAVAAAGKRSWSRAAERRAQAEAERAFELHPGERVPPGIRRIARGQIKEAAERLRSAEDPGKAVHGARKNFKRVRSVLRLAADRLDPDTRARENEAIRDAGRRLSGARDRQVMLETFDSLEVRADRFRAHLKAEHKRAQRALQSEREELSEVASALSDAELRVEQWEFNGARKPQRLAPGLKRIYARGRRELRRAERDPSAENLHEWRKRAKDLWYGAQVLHPVKPKRMRSVAQRAHDLADLLGDHHDLAVLREEALARSGEFGDQAERDLLLGEIDSRSEALQRDALAAGRKLYRRKPAEWTRRLLGAS